MLNFTSIHTICKQKKKDNTAMINVVTHNHQFHVGHTECDTIIIPTISKQIRLKKNTIYNTIDRFLIKYCFSSIGQDKSKLQKQIS